MFPRVPELLSRTLVRACLGALFAASALSAQAQNLRVLPAGDAITEGVGSTDHNGYRNALYRALAKKATSLDFVGGLQGGSMADPDHQGVADQRIDQLAATLDGPLQAYRPNVVTLHIGTVDIAQNFQLATAPDRLGALIDQILVAAPDASVVVASLVTSANATKAARIASFNAQLGTIVQARAGAGKHVLLADMSAVLAGDLSNGQNPNNAGYAKMAKAWNAGIRQAIKNGWIADPVPVAERLQGQQSKRCLQVAGNSRDDKALVTIFECRNIAAQQWKYDSASGEVRVYDGKCLDALDSDTTPGAKVGIFSCNGGPNQKWQLKADGALAGVQSGLCLDVNNVATENDSPVTLWDCNSGTNQKWRLQTGATSKIWVAAWADAPDGANGAGAEQTFRQIVKPTVGSRGTVRLHFSNYFGTAAVTLKAVHVGLQSSGAAVTGDVPVTFGKSAAVTIPAGAFVTSDEVALNFSYGQVLAVTEYVSGSWNGLTSHNQAGSNVTSYATPANAGDKTSDTGGGSFSQQIFNTNLLDRVEVFGNYKETIATFGSSTTDGISSGRDQHQTYPEQLAAALHAAGHDDIAIANVGIGGTTVLGNNPNSGIPRFARDVIGLPGVAGVIDYLGANDLRGGCIPAETLIAGKQNLQAQAHAAGLKIFLATTAPSTFCGAQNPSGFHSRFAEGSGEEAQRFLLASWVTATQPIVINGVTLAPPQVEGVIDFSGALADPANRSYMLPELDSGDDIHPNATGYAAMVRAIPLSLF